jgi:hypothetical protein
MAVVAVFATLVATSCYSYRTHAPGYPGVQEGGGKTIGSYLWGIFNEEPQVECNDQALAEVTVVDNLGFTLLTVVTLGIVNLKQIEWKCARANPTDGVFDTPDPPPAPDTTPADSTGSQ